MFNVVGKQAVMLMEVGLQQSLTTLWCPPTQKCPPVDWKGDSLLIRLPEQLIELIVKVLLGNDKALLVNRTLSCMVLKEALPTISIDIPAAYSHLDEHQIPCIVPAITNQVPNYEYWSLSVSSCTAVCHRTHHFQIQDLKWPTRPLCTLFI